MRYLIIDNQAEPNRITVKPRTKLFEIGTKIYEIGYHYKRYVGTKPSTGKGSRKVMWY